MSEFYTVLKVMYAVHSVVVQNVNICFEYLFMAPKYKN